YPFDSNRGAALSFGNHIGDKDYPLQTFHMVNSLVTGYADDVLMANNKEGVTANYHFYNCILRTPKPKETALLSNFTDVIWENNKDYPDGGSKQFLLVDGDKQKYDFHLKKAEKGEKYPAINAGLALGDTRFATDHDGKQRDSKPDIGCYELIAN
ncbi:MAG: right-handed parallel beta-helix repeat-containing protein, partial [Porphyromonas sp.]